MKSKSKEHCSITNPVGWIIPLLILAVMLGQGFRGTAQTTYGNIVGTVIDATGAAVPDAAITIRNDATGAIRTGTTGTSGNYLVDKLVPGQYSVTAELAGFKRFTSSGVSLLPIQSMRINITLEVGAVTEEITVTGEGAVIETERAEIAWTRTAQEFRDLPVLTPSAPGAGTFRTRDPLNFVFAVPGVNVTRVTSAGKINVYGAPQGGIIIRVDGVIQRDNSNGVSEQGRPIIEATNEMKVIGLNAAPEFDGQATILFTTKSGGSEFHGGGMYEGQQRAWTAQSWELNRGGTAKPFSKRNSTAMWLGGPIKKDKAFFFTAFDFERGLQAHSRLAQRNKPGAAFRAGDFSALIDPTFVTKYLGGTAIQIVDPMNNNAAFAGNIIPTARLNATSLLIQNDLFLGEPTRGGIVANAPLPATLPINATKFDFRIDYNFSDAHQMFSRVNISTDVRQIFDQAWEGAIRNDRTPARMITFSDTYALSPTVLNEFRFGHYRHERTIVGKTLLEGRAYQTEWGIQNIGPGGPGLPFIGGLEAAHGIASIGALIFDSRNYEVMDNVSILRGKHQYKFGYSLNRPSFFFPFFLYEEGNWAFSNKWTGFGYSDFLLGNTTSADLWLAPRPGVVAKSFEHNFYFQDTYQVTRRLTLEYGIRYQYHPRANAKRDQLSNFDPVSGGLVVPSATSLETINPNFPTDISIITAREAGFPFNMIEDDKNDISPRFSFAYRLDEEGKTVLRGGYGIFYNTYVLNMSSTLGNFGPYRGTAFSSNLVQAGTTKPTLQLPSPYLPFDPATGNVFISSVDKDLPNAQFHQYNLTLEREFSGNRLAVSFIGNYGSHSIGRDINQPVASTTPYAVSRRPLPNFNTLSSFTGDNILRYTALQVVGERRFKKGLFFRVSYDWTTHLTLDDADTGPVGGISVRNSYDLKAEKGNLNWGPKHRGLIVYSYELPFGPGKPVPAHGVLGKVIGGWQVNGITSLRSGLWFSPTFSGYDPSGTNNFSGRADRIGLDGGSLKNPTVDKWFDVSAFVCPGQTTQICDPAIITPIGRFGNSGRNILSGPGSKQMDFSIQKNFPIREAMLLEVQVQFINVFNTPQFGLPASNISAPASAGRITSTIPGSFRQVQFGARFEF